jgi:hypothetical protein
MALFQPGAFPLAQRKKVWSVGSVVGGVSCSGFVRGEGGQGCGDDGVAAEVDTGVELADDYCVIEDAISVPTAVCHEPDDFGQ